MINNLMNLCKLGNSQVGHISVIEANKNIPFDIRRIYYTYDVPIDIKRGMHAHKNLSQVLWCPYGIIEVILDNGENIKTYLLDSPDKLLLVGSGIWHDMYWKKEGSVLCVAASDYYNEDDYIRDYNEFLKYVEEGYWNNENKL